MNAFYKILLFIKMIIYHKNRNKKFKRKIIISVIKMIMVILIIIKILMIIVIIIQLKIKKNIISKLI
jgi:hypothetical protein